MKNSEPINEELLSAYLDGELSEAESLRVAKQIEQDDSLRATLSELEKIRDEIRQLPRHKLSSDFAAKITHSIEQQPSEITPPTTQRFTTTPRRIAGTLAAVAALLFISIWGIRHLPQSQNTAMTDATMQSKENAVDGVEMPQTPSEPEAAFERQQMQLADSTLAMDAMPAASNSVAASAAPARTATERFGVPQGRGVKTDGYDLVVDYELDAQRLDLVSTSWKELKKSQTLAESDSGITEYVVEGTPEEIRMALAALQSTPTKQLAETQVGQDYQNLFFASNKNSNSEGIKIERTAELADVKKVAPAPNRQSLSARSEFAEATESADSDKADDVDEETEPTKIRVLVRIRSK